jgi:hypothetical protein
MAAFSAVANPDESARPLSQKRTAPPLRVKSVAITFTHPTRCAVVRELTCDR